MNSLGVFLLVGCLLLFVGLLVLFLIMNSNAESNAWCSLADQLGLRYRGPDQDFANEHRQTFGILSCGFRRRAKHIIDGSDRETSFSVADYRFLQLDNRLTPRSYRRTVCLLSNRNLDMPRCAVRPRVLGERLWEPDIRFDDDPEFSQACVLQGEDEEAVRNAFTPAVRQAFVGVLPEWPSTRVSFGMATRVSRTPIFVCEAYRDTVLVDAGGQLAPKDLMQLVNGALNIVSALTRKTS